MFWKVGVSRKTSFILLKAGNLDELSLAAINSFFVSVEAFKCAPSTIVVVFVVDIPAFPIFVVIVSLLVLTVND